MEKRGGGTELYPDYTIYGGNYAWASIDDEGGVGPGSTEPAYEQTAPVPNLRFHYRHAAAELAGRAADLTWDRHQKAMMLWSAGMWIQLKYPQEADPYYKRLARLKFQPLGKATDRKRWFPEASPLMDYIHRSEDYIEPRLISRAGKNYGND